MATVSSRFKKEGAIWATATLNFGKLSDLWRCIVPPSFLHGFAY